MNRTELGGWLLLALLSLALATMLTLMLLGPREVSRSPRDSPNEAHGK